MAEGSGNQGDGALPMLGEHDPSSYTSQQAKERFAVAKFYGMGSDGEWTAKQIAEEMDVSVRQVYRYIHDSEIGQQAREMLGTVEAEWRLDLAIQLRKEVKRLEEIEQELLQKKEAVPTAFQEHTVRGTPTGDRNISLSDHANEYELTIPVPEDYETVTDYGPDLERVQKEKRNYLQQIAKLLGLDSAQQRDVDEALAGRADEVKIVEYRTEEDDYPEQEVIDVDGEVRDATAASEREEADAEAGEETGEETGDDVEEGDDR